MNAQTAIAHILAEARPILNEYGYTALFVTNFTEGFGIPLPGQTLLLGSSVLATTGDFDIRVVASIAFVAAVLGNCVGYLIGRAGGRALLLRLRISHARLERAESFFARRGAIVVVLARFLDGLRQTAPLVAGSLEMPWWRFFAATVVGAAAWVGTLGVGAYLVSENLRGVLAVLDQLAHHGWWITGLLLIAAVFWLVQRRRRKRRK
jgi:membrane protein DedA with SNARE-associated domain